SSSSGVKPCCLRNSRSSEVLTSSWWAIQASVRPCRTQARIWFSCGFSERLAISGRESIQPGRSLARPLRHQEGERLEHCDDDYDDGDREADGEDAEAHLAGLFDAADAASARAVGGAAAQLLAPAALEGGLLFEGRLELGDALAHSHRKGGPGAAGHRSKAAQWLAEGGQLCDSSRQFKAGKRPRAPSRRGRRPAPSAGTAVRSDRLAGSSAS